MIESLKGFSGNKAVLEDGWRRALRFTVLVAVTFGVPETIHATGSPFYEFKVVAQTGTPVVGAQEIKWCPMGSHIRGFGQETNIPARKRSVPL